MIAYAGALRLAAGQSEPPSVSVHPRWDMAALPAL
jgi:N6-L-threonylcarbamoyladenine synthase